MITRIFKWILVAEHFSPLAVCIFRSWWAHTRAISRSRGSGGQVLHSLVQSMPIRRNLARNLASHTLSRGTTLITTHTRDTTVQITSNQASESLSPSPCPCMVPVGAMCEKSTRSLCTDGAIYEEDLPQKYIQKYTSSFVLCQSRTSKWPGLYFPSCVLSKKTQ